MEEEWKTLIWGFAKREENTLIKKDSKISEEDPAFWIWDSNIRTSGFKSPDLI